MSNLWKEGMIIFYQFQRDTTVILIRSKFTETLSIVHTEWNRCVLSIHVLPVLKSYSSATSTKKKNLKERKYKGGRRRSSRGSQLKRKISVSLQMLLDWYRFLWRILHMRRVIIIDLSWIPKRFTIRMFLVVNRYHVTVSCQFHRFRTDMDIIYTIKFWYTLLTMKSKSRKFTFHWFPHMQLKIMKRIIYFSRYTWT